MPPTCSGKIVFYGNSSAAFSARLTRCRYLLGVVVPLQQAAAGAAAETPAVAAHHCPQCGGELVMLEVWPRPRAGAVVPVPGLASVGADTS